MADSFWPLTIGLSCSDEGLGMASCFDHQSCTPQTEHLSHDQRDRKLLSCQEARVKGLLPLPDLVYICGNIA